jgi:hypothetical protein
MGCTAGFILTAPAMADCPSRRQHDNLMCRKAALRPGASSDLALSSGMFFAVQQLSNHRDRAARRAALRDKANDRSGIATWMYSASSAAKFAAGMPA